MTQTLRLGVQWIILVLLLAHRGVCPLYAQSADDTTFLDMLGELREADYLAKEAIADRIIQSGHRNIHTVLSAFLEDRLYYRNEDQKMFLITPQEEETTSPELKLIDPITLQDAGTGTEETLTKIGTNNRLRRTLRTMIANFALSSPNVAVRLDAVREIARSLDDSNTELLRRRAAVELDPRVQKELSTGLALAALNTPDKRERLAAIATLRNSLSQDVQNKLEALIHKSEDGSFVEPDEEVRAAASASVKVISRWRTFYSAIETLFFGLSLGSVLVLISIGLAITFGVMGVINMAHGELMMIGAYTTYAVQQAMPNNIGVSILVAIPAAFAVAATIGVLIERTIIRHLYGRPLETLLATFGLSLIIQQGVRSIFSALNRSVKTPAFMSGVMQFNEALTITYNRIYIVLFTLMVFGTLLFILKRSRVGLEIRAVSQNRSMSRAMGIRSDWVDAMTFGLGSGIAGVAGVALSQLTNVGPNMGQSYIIDSFMVVVFGGVGNLWGALIGGLSMGIVNKLLEPYSGAVLAKIFVLIALILFIQIRPRGLFPQTGRSAENQ
jgi:urea transport system permease protein